MNSLVFNDYELLYLVKRGNEVAFDLLIKKYTLYAYKKAYSYYYATSSVEDIVQECLYELSRAIVTFQTSYNVLFVSYVDVIFTRKIKRLLSSQIKSKVLDTYLIDEAKRKGVEDTTNYTVIEQLIYNEYYEKIVQTLNSFEKEVLKDVLIGHNKIQLFAEKAHVSTKKVYNTIQAIRKKTTLLMHEN